MIRSMLVRLSRACREVRGRPLVAVLALLLAALPGVHGCSRGREGERDVVLATTTSLRDTGLLDSLLPLFERRTGVRVKPIAVGTGQALALAARGEADLAIAHAPDLEMRYVREGALAERRLVMANDFVLLGPPGDPAGVRGARGVGEALRRIAERRAPFASRGDSSGTHLLELALWRAAGASPRRAVLLESGQGMGATLRLASERGAYVLSDRATYLTLRPSLTLEVAFEGAPELLNLYHVLLPSPDRHPAANREGARAVADFLLEQGTQALIGGFGRERYGQPLFRPAAQASAQASTPAAR